MMHSTKLTIDACLNYQAYGEKKVFCAWEGIWTAVDQRVVRQQWDPAYVTPQEIEYLCAKFQPWGCDRF